MDPIAAPSGPTSAAVASEIAALRQRRIAATEKGFGPLAARQPVTAVQLGLDRPRLHGGGFTFPLLTLRDSAVQHNVDSMAAYCAAAGVQLAPHGKTMMAPQLAARQLAAGAWGITVATIGQLQTYRSFGVTRLLLANELVDPAGISWLAEEMTADPEFVAYCYVDSLEGVGLLDELWRDRSVGRRLPVLIELGFAGGRTGARSRPAATDVARAAAATSTLRVAGVSGYEGGLGHDADPATLDRVAAYGTDLRRLLQELQADGIAAGPQLLSAGGSAYFDVVIEALTTGWAGAARPTIVLRSGAYITHDHGHYADVSPASRPGASGALTLQPALELWAGVLSRPEPALALLNAGRRDVSFDEGLPVPLRVRHRDGQAGGVDGMRVTALNDQHAYLQVPPGARLAPGDAVGLGISHPCTAFDKWRLIPVVDDTDRVIDAVHTFF
jgi:D-serine dehydratase